MIIHQYPSVNELNHACARFIVETAKKCIAGKGSFNWVLTGGNSPKAVYHELATTYKNELDWDKVFFFFGDERNVPATANDYNGKMAKESILAPLGIAESQIFYVNTSLTPEMAAKDYYERLEKHFGGKAIHFDLVLLGMGDDAHTASIFPGTSLTGCRDENVAAVWVEKLNSYRISLTAPLINQAKRIAFLVFGEGKAPALAKVLNAEPQNPDLYPAQLIKPLNGELHWFIDKAAASCL